MTSFSNQVFPAVVFTAAGTSPAFSLSPNTAGANGAFSSGALTITGVGLTTATLAVNGSSDGGKTFYPLNISAALVPGTVATSVTVTTNGLYYVDLSGITHVQFVTSGTFTATSLSVQLTGSPNGDTGRAGSGGGGDVTSFNTRTGAVTSATNDYSFSQISGTATTAQLPIGTSGATVPLLNTANTWSATQTYTSVAITGGTIDGTSVGATTASTGRFTTVNATTSVTSPSGSFTNILLGSSIGNSSGNNNAQITPGTTGTVITRNIADANAALTVNLANPGSTGNILTLQKAGTPVASFDVNGNITAPNLGTASAQNIGTSGGNVPLLNVANTWSAGQIFTSNIGIVGSLYNNSSVANAAIQPGNSGTVITRNVADANPALVVNQSNASSTGNIQTWQFAGSPVATMSTGGTLALNGVTVGSGLTIAGGAVFSNNSTQTTVNNSTSGSTIFSQPERGNTFKKVVIYLNAATGTATYTLPQAFLHTPAIVSTNGLAASIVTALSTSSVTVTGAASTGFIFLEGY